MHCYRTLSHLLKVALVTLSLIIDDPEMMAIGQKVTSEIDTFLRNALQASLKKYVHYNRLEYGGNCSSSTEQLVGNLWAHYALHLSSHDPEVIRAEGILLLKALTNIINTKTSLCNYYKKLTCDPVGSTCVCLQGKFIGVETRTVREGASCVIRSGSYCTPPNIYNLNIKDAGRCEGGHPCIIPESPSTNCTVENFGGRASVFGEELRSGICVCSKSSPRIPFRIGIISSTGILLTTTLLFLQQKG